MTVGPAPSLMVMALGNFLCWIFLSARWLSRYLARSMIVVLPFFDSRRVARAGRSKTTRVYRVWLWYRTFLTVRVEEPGFDDADLFAITIGTDSLEETVTSVVCARRWPCSQGASVRTLMSIVREVSLRRIMVGEVLFFVFSDDGAIVKIEPSFCHRFDTE